MDYLTFIEQKRPKAAASGFSVAKSAMNPKLFPWQRDIVHWALRMGRRHIGVELKGSYYRLAVENCRAAEDMYMGQPNLFDMAEGG